MNQEAKDRLITGLSQYLCAQAAGSGRFAVADGYMAIDNFFSAILLDSGIDPTRNHRTKLNRIKTNFPNIFTETNTPETDLDDYYTKWQEARYSSLTISPNDTLKFLRISHRIIEFIFNELARRNGIVKDELEEEIYTFVLGDRWSSFDEECSHVHEAWQSRLEEMGEAGEGSKLGNKIANPSNFCEIRALTDDAVTKSIVSNDGEFAHKIANFYDAFLNLVDYVSQNRLDSGVDINEVPNYMLSLRMRYHGQTAKEIAEDFGKMISESIKKLTKEDK